MRLIKIILALLFTFLLPNVNEACTSFIVSGRVTPDGRPLALKNRDTPNLNNHVMIKQGERYKFIAVVSDDDKDASNVWQGHNEKGFVIFDTAAYNLNSGDSTDQIKHPSNWYRTHGVGWIMRRALEICATTKDFENFLDTLPRPLYSNDNIGVIDGAGGAAYYEVSNRGYVKYDVNDPKVAPYGYLIRTNHAFSGDRSLDQGIERYLAIDRIMLDAGFTGNLNINYLFDHTIRSLKHGLTNIDLYDLEPSNANEIKMLPFRDFIPRYLTASASLFQGVKKGENPIHTVAYTIIGSTLATVVVPLVITPEGKLPRFFLGNKENHSSMCQAGLKLKERLFPYRRGNGRDYIDLSQLINKENKGILQQVITVENEVRSHARPLIDNIRSDKPDYSKISQFYTWVDSYLSTQYEKRFGIAL